MKKIQTKSIEGYLRPYCLDSFNEYLLYPNIFSRTIEVNTPPQLAAFLWPLDRCDGDVLV